MTSPFCYEEAFDRNLGWLTSAEQERLRASRVAIAGVGGAGGFQAQALSRLGVGHFRLYDPDSFELTNLNRQIGATRETLGKAKVEVIRDMILSVNPTATVDISATGLDESNADAFLEGADVVIDGIDFFCLDAKTLLFESARQAGKTVITSCPLGFGASLLVFDPAGMSFRDYFDLHDDMDEESRRMAFGFGLSPTPLCFRYMNGNALSTETGRAASVSPGLMLVGALSASEAVKVLTGKLPVCAVPHVFQIDLITQKVTSRYYPMGMRSPLQKLKKWAAVSIVNARKKKAAALPRGTVPAGQMTEHQP